MWAIAPSHDVKINIFGTEDIYLTFDYRAHTRIGPLCDTLNAPPDQYPKGSNVHGEIYTGEAELRAEIYTATSATNWDRAAEAEIILPVKEYEYFISLNNKMWRYLSKEEELILSSNKPRNIKYEKKLFRKLMKKYHNNYEKFIYSTYDKLINVHSANQIDWS